VNIAFIVSQFPSVSETFVLNQITGLLERGHQVDIYTRALDKTCLQHRDVQNYRLLDRTYRLGCPRNRWTRVIRGIRLCVSHLGKNARAVLGSLNVFRYGSHASSLSLLFETAPFFRKYDIVHCQFGGNGRFGAILKQLGLQKKLVVTFHGYDIRQGIERGAGIYGELWNETDCLIAISKYNQDHLVRFGGNPRKIIYHPVGVDCKRFSYRPSQANGAGSVRLLSVARLVKEKGLSFGIQAVHRLLQAERKLQIQYDIIGEGYLRPELEQLIRDLNLGGTVSLLGAQEQDAVIQAMRESDIFIAPSLAEALPVSVMEAQAVGLPVLATKVGSVDQIVLDGRSGWLVPAGDAAALADKLGLLIASRQEWPQMSAVGRRHVEEHFDIDRLNDRLVKIYQQLLNGDLPPVAAQLHVTPLEVSSEL
jgi:colanic acid/amylovoran biosynthesis glycosyltransferase